MEEGIRVVRIDGITDDTVRADLLQELCFIWGGRYYGQLARLAQERQADLSWPGPTRAPKKQGLTRNVPRCDRDR